MDLSSKSLDELNTLASQIQSEIKLRKTQEIVNAREQILSISRALGLPLDTIMKGDAQSPKKGRKAGIKYRNPLAPAEVWSGRGRQPKWVKEWLDAGKPMEELMMPNHNAAG